MLGLNVITGLNVGAGEAFAYLYTTSPDKVAFTVPIWESKGLLSIEEWFAGAHKWALKVDMGPSNREGDIIYIPFPWSYTDKPRSKDAIDILRSLKNAMIASSFNRGRG